MTNLTFYKSKDHFINKDPYSQSYGFPSRYIQIWELDHKESRVPKKWCLWVVVLEKTLQNPLDSKEIKPFNVKGNKSWIFIGKTDGEAPIIWSPYWKSRLTEDDPDARKDWRQEKRVAEDEMVRYHDQLSGHEFEQILIKSRTKESGMLQSMWLQRVGHDLATEQYQHNNKSNWKQRLKSKKEIHHGVKLDLSCNMFSVKYSIKSALVSQIFFICQFDECGSYMGWGEENILQTIWEQSNSQWCYSH